MPVNLRSRPIEGYITDNAGNILRNAEIVIKEETPSGANIIDTAKSDDDGYFISKPIKNGVYDIYESGVRIYRQYHSSQPTVLQCYKPGLDSIPASLTEFSDFVSSSNPSNNINSFRAYLQVEPEALDVSLYGHLFPLWNIDPQTGLSTHPFANIRNLHPEISTSNQSKLTHTRYDVEFFAPLYAQNSFHRKIRWAGIPGIMFYRDSKIVLPLDYYSIIPTQNYSFIDPTTSFAWGALPASDTLIEIILSDETAVLSFFNTLSLGDIMELQFEGSNLRFWCILYYKINPTISTDAKIYGRMWNSSNSSHVDQDVDDLADITASGAGDVSSITVYQGLFNGIQNISQSTSEYYTVTENSCAQNLFTRHNAGGAIIANCELYNYTKA
jgi:hypothetical protein